MKRNGWWLGLAALALVACKGGTAPVTGGAGNATLTGAGSTFIYPLMSKWAAVYAEKKAGIRLNYQSIGSGGGIRQLINSTVDFGATDGPMSDAQITEAGGAVVHVPLTLGAVAIVTNLAGVKDLKLPGAVIADIFLGKVTTWNDATIAAANPGVTLPDRPIAVVHRSDGSGTTFIFLDFLAKVSPAWKSKVGVATSVNWPVGLGAKGSEGIAGTVKQTPGAIGYVELTYALQNNLPAVAVQNAAGAFVLPSVAGVSAAAAAAAKSMPADLRVSITNAEGAAAYPIPGFTWVVIRQEQKDCARAAALVDFLAWTLRDGQATAEPLHYAPLPPEVVTLAEAKLKTVTCGGKPVLP